MHAESGISGRHKMKAWKAAVGASGVLLTCASALAFALGFDLFDGDVIGHFNTTASIGAAIRTESQSANLLGKGNLSPTCCIGPDQTCQGLFPDQIYPSYRLRSRPGTYPTHGTQTG